MKEKLAQRTYNIGFRDGKVVGKAEGIKEVEDTIKFYDKQYPSNDWGNGAFRESLLQWMNNKIKEG